MNKKKLVIVIAFILTIVCGWIIFTNIDWLSQIQAIVQNLGWWGYAIFVAAYVIATLLILPVTAFNIAAGAIYGGFEGTLLTSIGAFVSALLGFILARKLGSRFIAISDHSDNRWSEVSNNLVAGGVAYSFASRLLPLIPYGVVSFAAGLSPIKRRDYLLGTILGTPLGIAPFVFLGSSGVQVGPSYDVLPLLASSLVLAVLIIAGTLYQQSRKIIQEPIHGPIPSGVSQDNYAELTE